MNLEERIASLAGLGNMLVHNFDDKSQIYLQATNQNNWFTKASIDLAFEGICSILNKQILTDWVQNYAIDKIQPKKIGVIMAGNIPMVGFHDWLSVLVCGHILYAKLSSQDQVLIKFLTQKLIEIDSRWADQIVLTERLNEIDAVIATGSNNSARYFHQYFAKKPHIIRKNRSSIAILNGDESTSEIVALGNDIFSYFGLGCRSISKLYVPEGFNVANVYDHWEQFDYVIDNHKYKNNYDYYKAIYLINQTPHFDNNFLLMKESNELYSPIGVLFFEYYKNINTLSLQLESMSEELQVVCSQNTTLFSNAVGFGEAQCPKIDDYADGIDTLEFLCKI
jgi:hypothetical protein